MGIPLPQEVIVSEPKVPYEITGSSAVKTYHWTTEEIEKYLYETYGILPQTEQQKNKQAKK